MTDRERAGALLLALLHASSPADVAGPINGEAVEDSLPENGVNRLRIGVRTTGSGSPIVTSKLRPGERKTELGHFRDLLTPFTSCSSRLVRTATSSDSTARIRALRPIAS